MKASLKELSIHQAVSEKNDLALAKLYELYGEKILQKLKRLYWTTAQKDIAWIEEAVNEAFLGYYNNPRTYDPTCYTLQRFLEIAAERDLKNILSKEKKHAFRQELPENVELQEILWNRNTEPSASPDATIITKEKIRAFKAILRKYLSDETDLTLAEMILAKERETAVYSEVLGLAHLSLSEQRVEVKKHKDRIKKVLERNDVENQIKNVLQ